MSLAEAFGLAVRRIRQERAITQEELAHRAGISLTSVARLETGRHGVRLETVLNMARAMQITGSELVAECERGMKRRR